MNKILVDNIILNNEKIFLNNEIKRIEAIGNCELNIFRYNITNLEIVVKDNSSLVINYFNVIDKLDSNITINLSNNSKIYINHSFINQKLYNFNLISEFIGSNSDIKINIYGVNDKGISNINITGNASNKYQDNYLDESIKMLNINKGKTVSFPKMNIDTCHVVATHNNTISGVDKNEILYLMSKGLSKNASHKLICDGFLVSKILENEMRIKIKEYLNGGDKNA